MEQPNATRKKHRRMKRTRIESREERRRTQKEEERGNFIKTKEVFNKQRNQREEEE
jgi:hypothetical protein